VTADKFVTSVNLGGVQRTAIGMSVCLCVDLCVCLSVSISQKPDGQI